MDPHGRCVGALYTKDTEKITDILMTNRRVVISRKGSGLEIKWYEPDDLMMPPSQVISRSAEDMDTTEV